MRGIAEWLASIGLGEYSQRFTENAIDLSVVRDLTEQDLKDLDVPLRASPQDAARDRGARSGRAPHRPGAAEPAPRDEAERRQLTVMFCDLVGSTALSARLDPEDMRAVIAAYHACIGDVIGRYQGIIARYMGDGVLAYFGYPQAHEDDAEQAVRAGLALVDAVANLTIRRRAAGSRRHRHGHGGRRRLLIGEGAAGAGGRRRDAEPRRAPAGAGRAGDGVDLPEHAPAHRGTLRLPRSRPARAERLGGADTGLAGAGTERRGEPLRGDAQDQAAAAVRARRGDRAAVAPLAACHAGGRPRRWC